MARLNDTQALTERPFAAGESHSISTRKIDNGYLTSVTTCNPNTKEYKTAEVFTKNPPKIMAPRMDGRQRGPAPDSGNTLRDAKAYLGDDV
jgi:hypothetical protein